MFAVRPLSRSQPLRATSRGALVKPPAAPPQMTPQDGTSFGPVAQAGAVWAAWAAVGIRAAAAPASMAVRTELNLSSFERRKVRSPPSGPAVVSRAWARANGAHGAGTVRAKVRNGCARPVGQG